MTRGRTDDPGRALRCEEARVLLMGRIDGELEPHAAHRLEDHLAVCVACRREERSYRELGRIAESGLGGGVDVDTTQAWQGIYSRIERRTGWVLLWIGILVLSGYGLWALLSDFLLASDAPIGVRVGVGALAAGSLLLLVSFVRETLARYRSERYREIER